MTIQGWSELLFGFATGFVVAHLLGALLFGLYSGFKEAWRRRQGKGDRNEQG